MTVVLKQSVTVIVTTINWLIHLLLLSKTQRSSLKWWIHKGMNGGQILMDVHSCPHQCLSRTFWSCLSFFFIWQRKSRRSWQRTGEEAGSGGCSSSARCRLSSTVSSGIKSSSCEAFHRFYSLRVFQGGPGHLYLLKNKVATFAKVEKEEDMSQWVPPASDGVCLFVYRLFISKHGQMDSSTYVYLWEETTDEDEDWRQTINKQQLIDPTFTDFSPKLTFSFWRFCWQIMAVKKNITFIQYHS